MAERSTINRRQGGMSQEATDRAALASNGPPFDEAFLVGTSPNMGHGWHGRFAANMTYTAATDNYLRPPMARTYA